MRSMFWIALLGLGASLLGCRDNGPTASATLPRDRTRPSTRPAATHPSANGLVVVSGDGKLGEADYGEKKTAFFTIKNGTAHAVRVEVLRKSCACAGIEIAKPELASGEATTVSMAWEPKADKNPDKPIKLEAVLVARGAGKEFPLPLTAEGVIKPAISVTATDTWLAGLTLGNLKDGKVQRIIEVTTARDELKDFTIEAKKTGPGLELAVEPFKPPAPAVAGYRVRVAFKEGLAVGNFREVVSISTKRYPFPLEVAFSGTVSVGGVTLDPENGINLEDPYPLGKDRTFTVIVRMTDPDERTLELVKCEPPWFDVKVAPDGKNTWRVSVTIPGALAEIKKRLSPDEKIANAMLTELLEVGLREGGVTLKSDNPAAPTIRIPVLDADLLPPK